MDVDYFAMQDAAREFELLAGAHYPVLERTKVIQLFDGACLEIYKSSDGKMGWALDFDTADQPIINLSSKRTVDITSLDLLLQKTPVKNIPKVVREFMSQ